MFMYTLSLIIMITICVKVKDEKVERCQARDSSEEAEQSRVYAVKHICICMYFFF